MQAKKTGIEEDELFRLQLLRDRYKSYVAYINGYHYLAIPHWTESDESYKVLIDNKIRKLSN